MDKQKVNSQYIDSQITHCDNRIQSIKESINITLGKISEFEKQLEYWEQIRSLYTKAKEVVL